MSSATEELRSLLDERGVEWKDGDASHTTEWTNANGQKCSAMYWKPTLSVLISGCTPEQAIAATLVSDREKELIALVLEMRNDMYQTMCDMFTDSGWAAPLGTAYDERIAALGIEVDA